MKYYFLLFVSVFMVSFSSAQTAERNRKAIGITQTVFGGTAVIASIPFVAYGSVKIHETEKGQITTGDKAGVIVPSLLMAFGFAAISGGIESFIDSPIDASVAVMDNRSYEGAKTNGAAAFGLRISYHF